MFGLHGLPHMDLRYETALRHATQAWSKNQLASHNTMQDLKQGDKSPASTPAINTSNTSTPTVAQPALARTGKLGTQLNLFA